MAENIDGGSLLDEVLGKTTRSGAKGCAIATFLREQVLWPIPQGKTRRYTRDEWQDIFDNEALQHSAILKVLQSYGYTHRITTVTHHRKRDCACHR